MTNSAESSNMMHKLYLAYFYRRKKYIFLHKEVYMWFWVLVSEVSKMAI